MKATITAIALCSSVWMASAASAAEPQNVKAAAAVQAGSNLTGSSRAWRYKFYEQNQKDLAGVD